MDDRLASLRQGNSVPVEIQDEENYEADPLWDKVSTAKANMSRVASLKEEMEKIASGESGVSDSESKLDALAERGNEMISDAKTIVFGLKNEAERRRKIGDESMAMIAENQFRSLARDLSDCMRDFEQCQEESKEMLKATLKRQVKIATGNDVNDDQVDELFRMQTDVFAQSLMQNTSSFSTARVTHSIAVEKHREIMAIETSLNELHEMFTDLAILLDQQSDIIDCIATNVTRTNQQVVAGAEDIKKARQYQSSSRKKLCCIILLTVIILAVLLVVLAIVPPVVVSLL